MTEQTKMNSSKALHGILVALVMMVASVASASGIYARSGYSGELRFAVLSDIHVFDTSLIVNHGEAFEDYLVNDRKMLIESKAIVNEALRQIVAERPDFVLISGDLTKDGELLCHRYVADSILGTLKENGIQALVVPGNHDINNPHAAIFDGKGKTRTTTISRNEFAEIYADYGYSGAIARDPASLSYVYQINDSLRVLALDACRYEENDFERDICLWQGRLRQATVNFAIAQLEDARAKGIKVIGLMHHGVLEHWKYQNTMLPGYVIDDYKRITKQLAKAGLKVVFTGHAHVQDAISHSWGRHSITDIETGSTVSYPIPYRMAYIARDSMHIETRLITSVPDLDRATSLTDYSAGMLHTIARSMIAGMLPETIDADTRQEATDMLSEYFVRYTLGDEYMTDADRKAIKQMAKRIARKSVKWSVVFREASKALLQDNRPGDNKLSVEF